MNDTTINSEFRINAFKIIEASRMCDKCTKSPDQLYPDDELWDQIFIGNRPTVYFISTYGRFFNGSSKILKDHPNREDNYSYLLNIPYERWYRVEYLVASVFIDRTSTPELQFVKIQDQMIDPKYVFHVSNLRWSTEEELRIPIAGEIRFYCQHCGKLSKYSGEDKIRSLIYGRKKFELQFPEYHLCSKCYKSHRSSKKKRYIIKNKGFIEIIDQILNRSIFNNRFGRPEMCTNFIKQEALLGFLSNGELVQPSIQGDRGSYPKKQLSYLQSIAEMITSTLE